MTPESYDNNAHCALVSIFTVPQTIKLKLLYLDKKKNNRTDAYLYFGPSYQMPYRDFISHASL